jgi:hypothetical protein
MSQQQEQEQMLAQAVQEVLARRNLSVNSASVRFNLDRGTLTKLVAGKRTSLDFIERWARVIGDDVNKWRGLAGYERVVCPADQLLDGLDQLAADFPDLQIPVPSFSGGAQTLTSEKVRSLLHTLRQMAEEGRHPKKSPNPLPSSRRLSGGEETNKSTD